MAASSAKHVPKRNPVLINQNLKPVKRPVERIQQQLRQRAELACSVPPVGAVYQDVLKRTLRHLLQDVVRSVQDKLDELTPPSLVN